MTSRLATLLIIVLIFAVNRRGVQAEDSQGQAKQTVRLPVMTWYHPLLEPGIADILILCTVSKVSPAPQKYGNDYWRVTLRIDERIHLAEHYRKRLEEARFIESGDFRKRAVGDRILLFAGGEKYETDDLHLPCWSGTETDLGILLHPKGHLDEDENVELLSQLRQAAAAKGETTALFRIFAEFSPKGVAYHLIRRLEMEQFRREGTEGPQGK